MSGRIEPALTPEEWRKAVAKDRIGGLVMEQNVWLHDNTLDGVVEITLGHSYDPVMLSEPESRHKLAAVALHGQPFGFTWDDVDALRWALQKVRASYELGPGLNAGALLRQAEAAVDRIAALLPPREEP